jgi:hypothetical protein
MFAVLKDGIGGELAADFRKFFRRSLFLISRERSEPAVDFVDLLESLEV